MDDQSYCVGSCTHCGQHIQFPAEGLGMEVNCPHCNLGTTLLEESYSATEAFEEITAAELQSALEGPLPRTRVSVFYQAGLLLVALFMVLLPLAYLAVVGSAAYGVYWYATHAHVIFTGGKGGGVYGLLLRTLIYLGPLVGGIVAVFFMFKPLLAGSVKRQQSIELDPSRHPRLFQFIAGISSQLHSPMPKRIYLDCDLNACVGFRRGWLSFFGNDLMLRIGVPLAAGLNTREFACVIAHELGHCTQSFAMRLGYAISRINGWFVRVVYQRDSWDESLDEWRNSVEGWLTAVVVCIDVAVSLSRNVLRVFMLAGHAASCFLSRQMEFHADRCAMSVAGSSGLESLLFRFRELSIIQSLGYKQLRQLWIKDRNLPDSVADFLHEFEKRLPADFRDQARLTLINETAGLWSTHPTPAQRVQKARQRAVEGVFTLEKPVRALFSKFDHVCRVVTMQHYRADLGLPIAQPALKPATEFFQSAGPAAPPR